MKLYLSSDEVVVGLLLLSGVMTVEVNDEVAC
jgi:hypothetical protein